ncbi:MAG: aminoacyl-tRNA hydrolase [Verrucomicrobiota bacterium]
MSIAVIAGLGNPGTEYVGTRHNIGFVIVDALAASLAGTWKQEKKFHAETAKVSLAGQPVTLLKPTTYVNDSGRSLGAWLRFYRQPVNGAVVVYDEINLELARLKLATQGSAGGHNGIASLLQEVGDGFIRYRIGIGGKGHPAMDLKDWVLGKFTPEEQALIDTQLPSYLDGLHLLSRLGPEATMNQLNTRTPPPSESTP